MRQGEEPPMGSRLRLRRRWRIAARASWCAVVLLLLPGQRVSAQGPAKGGSIEIDEPGAWRVSDAATLRTEPSRSLFISGTVRHSAGILEVLINGGRTSMQPVAGGVRFTGYAAVTPDTREVVITAYTGTRGRFSQSFRVEPARDTVAATPQERWKASSGGFKGRRWAVVIGISQYQDRRVQQLRFADRDAKMFYEFLRSERAGLGGIPPENIQLLTNQTATYRALRTALFSFLKQAGEDDVVYIYYAGHGAPDPDRPDNLYLLPYDVDPANVAGTALPMEDVNTAIRKILAHHVVVITDACHSAGVAGQLAKRAGGYNPINDAFLHKIESSGNVNVTFTSSEADQLSQEGTRWGGGHGVFTYFLLQGLIGAADENHDQIVSLGEAMEWTREQVRRATENAQIPSISQTAYDRQWPMGLVLPGADVPVISEAEVQKYTPIMSMMSSLYDQPWGHPDSLLSFVGVPDTVRITIDSITREVLNPTFVKWSSSSAEVAAVDSEGVVHPLRPGLAEVTAIGFGRRTVIPVRVFAHPSFVRYAPGDTILRLVTGSTLRVSADVLFPNGQWLRGLTPVTATGNVLVLGPDATSGGFIALREGETELISRIAGQVQRWGVKVRSAPIRIVARSGALALDDSLEIAADVLGPDGQSRGRATSVSWRTSDGRTAAVRDGTLYGRGLGRATIYASRGMVEDSITVFVTGDVLVAVDSAGQEWITPVSSGRGRAVGGTPLEGTSPALSPDGQTLAFVSSRDGGFPRIFLADADGANVRRLTPKLRGRLGLAFYREIGPVWSNDGKRVFFASDVSGGYQIYSIASTGGELKRITTGPGVHWHPATAPDAPTIAYEKSRGAGQAEVVLAMPDGGEAHRLTLPGLEDHRPSQKQPHLLPGGEELLYVQTDPDRYSAGDLLMWLNSTTNEFKLLVHPRSNERLVYAVSPDAKRIAFLQYPRLAKGGRVITVIDLDGKVVATIRLPAGLTASAIGWGAGQFRAPERAK